jgi:regulator of nucleoside diphosphate kinase
MSYLSPDLPPITLDSGDFDRLQRLTNAAADKGFHTADFLEREISRATIVDSSQILPGLVRMGSRVEFRDDITGTKRRVTLVYPEEADIAAGKISVLTPVGAALVGLSVSQSIEWETTQGVRRSLTVLDVENEGAPVVANSPVP